MEHDINTLNLINRFGRKFKGANVIKIRRHLVTIRLLMIILIVAILGIKGYDILKVKDGIFDKPMEININMHYRLDPVNGLTVTTFKNVDITAYNNTVDQCDKNPNWTASTRMVAEGIIAISQDYFRKTIFPGDLIYVKKLRKWFIADDCKNVKFKHSFDVFMFDKKKAIKFGKVKSDVYVLRLDK